MQIDIATDIITTGMQLLWTVPMSTMLLESMQNILLPLLLNIGLLALALFGFTTFRHYKGRSHSSGAGLPSAANSELRLLRAINEEIVSLAAAGAARSRSGSQPNGYQQSNCRPSASAPESAEHHQYGGPAPGVIQATVNNEQYEIRQYRSQVAPRTQILIIRDQDREVLVNKKAQAGPALV